MGRIQRKMYTPVSVSASSLIFYLFGCHAKTFFFFFFDKEIATDACCAPSNERVHYNSSHRMTDFPADFSVVTFYPRIAYINFYIYYIINIFAEASEQWRRARWPRAWRSPRSLIRKSNSNSNRRATAQYLAVLLVKTLRWATEIVPATSAVWHREATWSRRSVCGEKSPTAMNDVGCRVLTPVSNRWGRCCRTTRARNFLR